MPDANETGVRQPLEQNTARICRKGTTTKGTRPQPPHRPNHSTVVPNDRRATQRYTHHMTQTLLLHTYSTHHMILILRTALSSPNSNLITPQYTTSHQHGIISPTFPSSPRALASFASSFRRSSVTGGMFNRITLTRE